MQQTARARETVHTEKHIHKRNQTHIHIQKCTSSTISIHSQKTIRIHILVQIIRSAQTQIFYNPNNIYLKRRPTAVPRRKATHQKAINIRIQTQTYHTHIVQKLKLRKPKHIILQRQ